MLCVRFSGDDVSFLFQFCFILFLVKSVSCSMDKFFMRKERKSVYCCDFQ